MTENRLNLLKNPSRRDFLRLVGGLSAGLLLAKLNLPSYAQNIDQPYIDIIENKKNEYKVVEIELNSGRVIQIYFNEEAIAENIDIAEYIFRLTAICNIIDKHNFNGIPDIIFVDNNVESGITSTLIVNGQEKHFMHISANYVLWQYLANLFTHEAVHVVQNKTKLIVNYNDGATIKEGLAHCLSASILLEEMSDADSFLYLSVEERILVLKELGISPLDNALNVDLKYVKVQPNKITYYNGLSPDGFGRRVLFYFMKISNWSIKNIIDFNEWLIKTYEVKDTYYCDLIELANQFSATNPSIPTLKAENLTHSINLLSINQYINNPIDRRRDLFTPSLISEAPREFMLNGTLEPNHYGVIPIWSAVVLAGSKVVNSFQTTQEVYINGKGFILEPSQEILVETECVITLKSSSNLSIGAAIHIKNPDNLWV